MFRVFTFTFTFTLTHFLAKTIFPERMGGVQNSSGNSGGVRLFYWSKNGTSEEEGGLRYVKFPPWWGYGYFLELHILERNLTSP